MKNLRYALLLIVGAGLVATLDTMALATRSASGGGSDAKRAAGLT